MGFSGRAIVAGSSVALPLGCSLLADLPSDYGLDQPDATSAGEAAPEANPPDRGVDAPPPFDAGLDAGCGDTLSNGSNCGACGHSCLGGSCEQGVCLPVTLVNGESGPTALLLLGAQLYWTATGGIRTCTLPACASPHSLCPAFNGFGLAGDPSNLYWTQAGDNTIQTAPTGGCDASAPTIIESTCGVSDIASDDAGVFWARDCQPDGGVAAAALNGTGLTGIASSELSPAGVALGPGVVYWTNSGDSTNALVIAGRDGSDASTIGSGNGAYRIALAPGASRVFWTNSLDGTIGVAALDGTDAGGVFAASQANPSDILVDGARVVWIDYAQGAAFAGAVKTCPISGCTLPVTLASGLNGPSGLASDDQRIYWAGNGDGTIMALAK